VNSTRFAGCASQARIRHTSHVHPVRQLIAVGIAFGLSSVVSQPCQAQAWQKAVDRAAIGTPAARIIVLDILTGRVLAARQMSDMARTLAAPGSTLKPLVLYGLVDEGRWNPAQRVACNRHLVIAGRSMACSHPLGPPFNAREALSWSCNSYFAQVAQSLKPGELGRLLRPTGLLGATGLTRDEAIAEFREPQSIADNQLALLGAVGVRVTPLELAAAYKWLAQQLAAHPNSQAAQVVRAGIQDSTEFGMAGQASLGGVAVAGKTGTAEGEASHRTHGWFVGLAPASNPRVIVLVFTPSGRGADAAQIAGELLAQSPLRQP
jgi:cell division protein FtsI/penicillin-binding protein 2